MRKSIAIVTTAGLMTLSGLAPTALAQEIRVGTWKLPGSLGVPFTENGAPSIFVWAPLYDALTFVDQTGAPTPALALSWQNTSPTTWRLQLREGVKFSNGADFDAASVAATFAWLGSEEGKAKGGAVASQFSNIQSVRGEGRHTVVIETKTPDAVIPSNLSVGWIVEAKAWAELGFDGYARSPVGTGSYKLKSWGGTQASLEAHGASWRAPKIPRLEIFALPERPARVSAFESNQLDIVTGLSPDDVDRLRQAKAYLDISPAPNVLTWGMTQINAKPGVDVTPLADKRVRQAVNHAVNNQLIEKELLRGIAGKATGQGVTSVAFGHNPNVKPYSYDPSKARALLAEAGYARGLKVVADVVLGAFSADGDISQQVAQDLSKIGVDVTLQTIAAAEWFKRYRSVTFEGPLWLNSWSASPAMDASAAIRNQTCQKGGTPYICDRRQQDLFDAANAEFDARKRLEILRTLVALQHDEAINLFLVEYTDIYAASANLKGFRNTNRNLAYHEMEWVRR